MDRLICSFVKLYTYSLCELIMVLDTFLVLLPQVFPVFQNSSPQLLNRDAHITLIRDGLEGSNFLLVE